MIFYLVYFAHRNDSSVCKSVMFMWNADDKRWITYECKEFVSRIGDGVFMSITSLNCHRHRSTNACASEMRSFAVANQRQNSICRLKFCYFCHQSPFAKGRWKWSAKSDHFESIFQYDITSYSFRHCQIACNWNVNLLTDGQSGQWQSLREIIEWHRKPYPSEDVSMPNRLNCEYARN